MLASREQQVTVAREQLQAARLELDTDRRKLQVPSQWSEGPQRSFISFFRFLDLYQHDRLTGQPFFLRKQ